MTWTFHLGLNYLQKYPFMGFHYTKPDRVKIMFVTVYLHLHSLPAEVPIYWFPVYKGLKQCLVNGKWRATARTPYLKPMWVHKTGHSVCPENAHCYWFSMRRTVTKTEILHVLLSVNNSEV